MWPFNRKPSVEPSASMLQMQLKDCQSLLGRVREASAICQARCDDQAALLDAAGVVGVEQIEEYCKRKSRDLRTAGGQVAALSSQLKTARTSFTNLGTKLRVKQGELDEMSERARHGIEIGYDFDADDHQGIHVRVVNTWFDLSDKEVVFREAYWHVVSLPDRIPGELRDAIEWLIREQVPSPDHEQFRRRHPAKDDE